MSSFPWFKRRISRLRGRLLQESNRTFPSVIFFTSCHIPAYLLHWNGACMWTVMHTHTHTQARRLIWLSSIEISWKTSLFMPPPPSSSWIPRSRYLHDRKLSQKKGWINHCFGVAFHISLSPRPSFLSLHFSFMQSECAWLTISTSNK